MEPLGCAAAPAVWEAGASAAASGGDSAADAAAQSSSGQMHAAASPYHRVPPPLRSCNAPVRCACCCAGAGLAARGARPRVDADGQPACERCGRRLSRCKGKLYASPPGKCCHGCYDAVHTAVTTAAPQQRIKRPYDTLGPTQRCKRRKQALADITNVLQQTGVPVEALRLHPRASPAELVHLPTSVREQIRSVPSLRIPSEQSMIACKQQLAHTHATETGTFAGGAYITDPLAYVSVLCAQSPFIAVGGDAGGGRCVLGVTYSTKGVQHFAALLVYEGGDSWLELQDCRAEGLTPFKGTSAAFLHIWAVLQYLIDHKSVSTTASSAKTCERQDQT
jgi:hypothetical protein